MNNCNLTYKELSIFNILMEKPSKQVKKRDCSEEDKIKMLISSITSVLTESEPEFAKTFLDAISEILYEFLKVINESEDHCKLVKRLMQIFDPSARTKPFSVSRTFMQQHIPVLTRKQMEDSIEQNYIEEMNLRKNCNAKSKDITLAIDMTHQSIDTKYKNGDLAYLVEGQERKFTLGFNFLGLYDVTHNLGLGFNHSRYHNKKGTSNEFKPWIKELQSKIQIVHSTGSNVKLVEADRGYFDAEIFAASHLRLLDIQNPGKRYIRVIVPKKFPPGKDGKKWEFLLNPSSTSINPSVLMLSKKSPSILVNACKMNNIKYENYEYIIPTVDVALVGEYNGSTKYTLEWAKNKAQYIEKELNKEMEQKKKAENDYLNYKSKTVSNPKIPNCKRGKNRKKFKDITEKTLYDDLFFHYKQFEYYQKQKSDLLCSLLFFTISLDINEDPMKNPSKYIEFAIDYHERWMIENCFRDIKKYFIPKSRARKPTRRQFNFMFGMILYNKWQRFRTFEILEKERKRVHNIVPWNSRRCHIRKKWSVNKSSKLSARVFLLQIWTSGIISCLNKLFNQLTTNQ
jgi:hypothetical protein